MIISLPGTARGWEEQPLISPNDDPFMEQLEKSGDKFMSRKFDELDMDYGIFKKDYKAAQDFWECMTSVPDVAVWDKNIYCLSSTFGQET